MVEKRELSLLETLAASFAFVHALSIPPTLLYLYYKKKRFDAEINQEMAVIDREMAEIYKKISKK
ncbi:unnamed protein product [Rhodiola kirilowii]